MDSEETPKSEIILYQTEDSRTRSQCRFENETLSHIAASICGHTEEVSKENYWKVGEEDLDRTMKKLSTIHSKLSPSVALNIALLDDVKGLNPSSSDLEGLNQGTKKPKESPGFVSICRLLAKAGFTLRVGDIGLEPTTSTMSTLRSNQLS